ncbi:hypothetical protein HRW14_13675 [Streptomyces lunaelactis]|nr:hypothetical protein [Streptomyces lunaelactis]NUK18385.1 hypothetical protein [Streptomyces lunaelactis]NUK51302.1 hypothetical protein [Streptomyces lunaelactis]NUK64682.1 hypothetical protein [Streptomyces lunaelactis]
MMQEFPPPPRADEFSELVKRRLDDVRTSGGTRETVTVDWNGQSLHCEVVDCPVVDVYFNPGTHRIRAQRSHNPTKDEALSKDPWAGESQEYLQFLLQADPANPSRRDPDFDKLKESLQQFGQNDPGLITHQGILVNGNTRTAAFRELGQQTMRVGVLPESFTWTDINAVELSLQLRRDHRRDYSYINRLLAMEEQAGLGRTPEAIAKDFRIRVSTYQQERWILGTIREQIERSKSGGGIGLRLVDFEDHQEKLKELHRAYEKLAAVEPDRADVLKELRMAAIVLGFAKTDVRHIDESFRDRYLSRTIPASLSAPAEEQSAVVVPGLGGVTIPGATSAVSAARALNDQVLRAKAAAGSTTTVVPEQEKREAQGVFDGVREAFDKAIDAAGRDARLKKRKQMAPARLADACADIDQCVVELVQARASRSLDEEAFDEAVLKLRESLRRLAKQAGRGSAHPGDGVTWLLGAAILEAY